jgi:hypothetical protein
MANAFPSARTRQPWDEKERRQSRRMRLVIGLPVRVGRRDGTLVEISRGGARVRHVTAVKADSEVTLTFNSNGDRFAATGRVLSSRVVGLGTGEGGATMFETILRYTQISAESLAIVEQMLGPEPA